MNRNRKTPSQCRANTAATHVLLFLLFASVAQAQQPIAPPVGVPVGAPVGQGANPITGKEITPELEQAVERGLQFLAQRQMPNGKISGYDSAASGITGSGNTPGRGKYGQQVQKCVDFILAEAQQSGLLGGQDQHAVMYSHGFATLFLAEVYGMTGDERVREVLVRAIRLIESSQNREGGWRYQPLPLDADVSVTICQVMALRAARDAGIKVDKQVVDRAIAYVKKCQNEDGGFSYMLGGGSSLFPRSAAGVATLYYAGIYSGPEVEKGLEYVQRFAPGEAQNNEDVVGHYYYGHYYAVQVMFMAGGDHWAKWFPAIRDELLERQNKNIGSWDGEASAEYATAMALIILQMPNRYLPVFSGKGPGS
jgi:Prenyltransferase and squalene oxidase repeat